VTPKQPVVVVDGSNLATEGRTTPSLTQLDESVRAFHEEEPGAELIVVVDATFEHRVAKEERTRLREAMLAGEVITPPAGTIGRGDAFILKIAERAGGVVLSNDSFQEFHAQHPWLFDEGRLVGGKPIPGVGWIFTPRNPVKGPTSRAVRAKAASATKATAAKTAVVEPATDGATRTTTRARRSAAAASPAPAKATAKAASKATAAPAKAAKATKAPVAAKRTTSTKRATTAAASATKTATRAAPKATKAASAATAPRARDTSPGAAAKAKSSDPVNSARVFKAFVAAHPLRSKVEGDVTSFTSHGAIITVSLPRGAEAVCYAPLAGLGKPAPTRVRDVLEKGERRTFQVVAIDGDRHIAELALVGAGRRRRASTAEKASGRQMPRKRQG
jgi:hypothetical protein